MLKSVSIQESDMIEDIWSRLNFPLFGLDDETMLSCWWDDGPISEALYARMMGWDQ